MTLYEELKRAGVRMSNYRSDLYFEDTETTREILGRHGKTHSRFSNQVENETWIEVPFAYDPYWEAKQKQ